VNKKSTKGITLKAGAGVHRRQRRDTQPPVTAVRPTPTDNAPRSERNATPPIKTAPAPITEQRPKPAVSVVPVRSSSRSNMDTRRSRGKLVLPPIQLQKRNKVSGGRSRKSKKAGKVLAETKMTMEDIEAMSIRDLCKASVGFGTDPLEESKPRGRKRKADTEVEPVTNVPQQPGPETQQQTKGPRVRMVDGKMVLDESSLVVSNPGETEDLSRLEHIEESHSQRRITSSSFSNKQKPQKWTLADTEKFYEGLRVFGTDFELIARLFANRTRRQIKLKFNKEERSNRAGVDSALKERKKLSDTGLTLVEYVAEVKPKGLSLSSRPIKKLSDHEEDQQEDVAEEDVAEEEVPENEEPPEETETIEAAE
jgi:transcription factor TFIIIB component B''